jgi:hypothetical protein
MSRTVTDVISIDVSGIGSGSATRPVAAVASEESAGADASGDGFGDAPEVMDGVRLRKPKLIQHILTRKERGVPAVPAMTSWLF